MNANNNHAREQRTAQLKKTIQYAEFEMMVALLSFSMLATYASDPSPTTSLRSLAQLLKGQME